MLAIEGLSVFYDDLAAVREVSLTVAPGEILALLGPSGCGKSTLLRAIAGLEHVDHGTIAIAGVNQRKTPIHHRGLGLMFQEGVLFPHRTVAGNVAYGLRGVADAGERVTELLTLVGLAGYEERSVATLSGGEAQRVALARALAPHPRLLLLDEPLAALDRQLRESLLADLRMILHATDTTAVFVTHDQSEAFAIANRIALMHQGEIVQVGAPRDIWRYPATIWAAKFLGCRAIISAADWQQAKAALGNVIPQCLFEPLDSAADPAGSTADPAGNSAIGVRDNALLTDPAGPIIGRVTDYIQRPEYGELTVEIVGVPGLPKLPARSSRPVPIPIGEVVELRCDAQGLARIGIDLR